MPPKYRVMSGRWLLAMVMICGLAWLLFITHLDGESLWYDEWFSWHYTSGSALDAITATSGDVHPPLYYLWLWLWIKWMGSDGVLVMRLSSVIPALLSVALCYRLGCDWFRSRWIGLAAAAFLATSGVFIYYARELRMYTLVVLLVLASWWLWWRWLHGPDRRRSPWRYAALVGILAYTYYFAAFVVVVQAAAGLIQAPRRFPRLLAAYAAALIGFAPWLPVLINQLVLESERAGRGSTLSLANLGKFAANQPTSLDTIGAFVNTYSAFQPAFVLLLIVLALTARRVGPRGLAVGWFFGIVCLFFALNLVIPVYNPRYVLMALPGLALLVGAGAYAARIPARVSIIALIVLVGTATHTAAFLPPKAPHHDLMSTISARFLPGDRIWYNLDSGALGSTLEFERGYYLEHDAPNLSTDDFVWDAPHDFAGAARVWDVRPYWITMPEAVQAAITAGRALSEAYTFGVYTLRLYEAPPDTASILFGDLFELRLGRLNQPPYHAGDTVPIRTWWRAQGGIPLDYSYGLHLRGPDGATLAQTDAGLQVDGQPTSRWTPACCGLINLALTLPAGLAPGEYGLWLAVYYWEDPQPLTIRAPDGYDTDGGRVRLTVVTVR